MNAIIGTMRWLIRLAKSARVTQIASRALHQYLAFLDVDQSIGIGDLTCSDIPAGGGGDNHNLEFPQGAL
jgi:hypothetical protein